eukprot:9547839-Alexandrium_andersonii.AAC.1
MRGAVCRHGVYGRSISHASISHACALTAWSACACRAASLVVSALCSVSCEREFPSFSSVSRAVLRSSTLSGAS